MAKNNSEMKSIRKKLVAAIAMVMVASIMVVSSSYAWFTLSTAPEVRGIQTSIGGNGNLEIALRTIADVDNIGNTTSGGSFPAANSYWGNLVDLSDDATYKMSRMALAPARLNLAGGKINVGASYLLTAVYGTDGRVSGLEANTFAGKYNATQGGFASAQDYGVRGVGTKSGMSAAENALRDARNAVSAAKGQVEFQAKTSLEVDSIKLANILIYHELNAAQTFTAADRANVEQAIARLEGIVTTLEDSLKATVLPVLVVVAHDPDLTVTGTPSVDKITVSASDITIADFTVTKGSATVDIWTYTSTTALKDALTSAAGKLAAMKTTLGEARGALPAAGAESYTFDQLSTPLTKLLSKDDIAVYDKESGTEKGFGDYGSAVDMGLAITGGNPLRLKSGLYNNIGEFIGNYDADTTLTLQGNFGGGLNLTEPKNFPVTMQVRPTAPVNGSFYLPYFGNMLASLKVEGGDDTGLITEIYAMAIDLAFKTNAKESNLLLQTDASTRVDGNDAAGVQGAGSYMEFTITDAGYSAAQLKELMAAIRVVFFDYDSGEICAVALLDSSSVPTELGGTAIKAGLALHSYETAGDMLTVGDKISTETDGITSGVITSLTQNQAKGISVLIYMDGDMVDNGDVGISSQTASVKVNLQFASSADLVPMNYTFSTDATTAPEGTEAPTTTPTVGG